MPEAVVTDPPPFAPRAPGAVSSNEEASVPREPMHTSQPTSAPHRAPRTIGRRSKLALAGALVLLVLLVAAAPAAARSTQYAFTITGHGWGHGVGMSQWGAYGYAKHGWEYKAILKHYYTGIGFTTVADSVVRVNLRSGLSAVKLACANDYTVKGSGAATTIPGGTDGHSHVFQPRLQGRRRIPAQDVHRRADLHTVLRRAQAHHHDRPRRRRHLPRHDPRGAQRRRAHDDQSRAARELPPGRRPARGALHLADGRAQGAGLRGARVRPRQQAARQIVGRLLRRARPGVHGHRHREDPHEHGGQGDRRRVPHVQRQAHRGRVLLLLRRGDRGRQARLGRHLSVPQGRQRPLRLLRYPARLGSAAPHTRPGRRPSRRGRLAARGVHAQARHLAAHRQGRDHRERRHQVH